MRFKTIFGFQSMAMYIIAINVIVFFVQTILGDGFTNMFMLVSDQVLQRPWMLVTHMFLHGGPYHLLFNMYALLIFGPLIEQRIGSKRFLIIYFASGIIAALPYLLIPTRALGASAAIMGIIGVTIMLIPDLRLLLFFAIPITLRTAAVIFVIIDVFGIFFQPGVANFAHLMGLACGSAYGYYLVSKKHKYRKEFTEKTYHTKHKGHGIELSKDDIEEYLKHGRL